MSKNVLNGTVFMSLLRIFCSAIEACAEKQAVN